ncbi:MAG: tryptophan-rich sensory protein [Naasia sp.]
MTTLASTRTSGADTIRQIAVAVSAVIAVVGSFVGSGAAGGTPIAEAAGGALSASSTQVAPGGPAFSIWSVIYAGLIAYAIWQLLPAQRSAERHRVLGYPVALSLLLNAAWILSIQFDALPLSVPIIVALLAVLVWAFFRALAHRPTGTVDAVLTDGTIGLYLGWVSVATIANTAALLTAAGFDGLGIAPEIWGAALALVAGVVGVLLAIRGRGRIAPMLSLCWGLAWIAIARFTGPLFSEPTAWAALIAVVAVVAVTLVVRSRAGWTSTAARS